MKMTCVRIGDLGRVVTGRTPSSSRPELFGNQYPFITPTDIQGGMRYVATARHFSEEGASEFQRGLLPAEAVCVTCIASIGKVCMTQRPSFTNQQINAIVVDRNKFDPYYVFAATRLLRQELVSKASGAATPIINKSDFEEIKILTPDLPTQTKIAAILSAYDDLIELNDRRIAIFEEVARQLFDEWFVRFRYPGHEAVQFVETELGMMPEGWQPRKLSWWTEEVRDTVSPQKVEPHVAYVGLEHLPRRSTTLVEVGKAQNVTSSKLKFKAGDILFGKIRPYFHKVALMPFSGVCSTDAICIRPTNPKTTTLILGLTSSDAFVAHAVATSNGTKMPRADWKVLKNYPLPEPPRPLLEAFERTVSPMVHGAANLAAQNTRLRAAHDLLLPKLISGEIHVSLAEQDFAEAAE